MRSLQRHSLFFVFLLCFSSFPATSFSSDNSDASEKTSETIAETLKSIETILDKMKNTELPAHGKKPEEFGGINFGIGLGASYLDDTNIKEAVVVGSQTRVVSSNKKSADFILETHYLIDVMKSKRTTLKRVINNQIETLTNLLNGTETANINQIQSLVLNLCDSLEHNRYYTSIDETKIKELVRALWSNGSAKYANETEKIKIAISKLKPEEADNRTKFGLGPFCYMKMGGDNIISGFGLGIMFGFKDKDLTNGRIFNLGIARGFQNNCKKIAEGFNPAVESGVSNMLRTQDIDTWTVVLSTNLW